MISALAVAPPEEFESLLTAAVKRLEITLRTAPPMGNEEFENAVCKSMQQSAKATAFDGKVQKTPRGAFPDVTAARYYGVEAKQVQKDNTRTRGNSIFESARVDGVESVYLIMCWNAGSEGNVKWRKYEDAIVDVVITHSPRYQLDMSLSEGETLFDRIGIGYDEFRNMSQEDMMNKVRQLYDDGDRSLWWLETRDRAPMRHFEVQNNRMKHQLIGEAFFLCPVVFGSPHDRKKYTPPMAYWLSQGFASQGVRDKFTSSGIKMIDNIRVQQIIARALRHKNDIIRAANSVDDELILHFWDVSSPPILSERISEWFAQVKQHYTGNPAAVDILKSKFN